MSTKIILTSSAAHIRKGLEKRKISVIIPGKNRDSKGKFPDGEVYVALSGIKRKEERCVVVHSGSPNPNDGLMELKIILEILKNLKVKSIELFFLYFPYGMQDEIFDKGEANVAENLVKEFVHYYGVKKIYTVDAHFYKKAWTKKYPLVNIQIFPEMVKIARKYFPEIIFLAPDKGSKRRSDFPGTEKRRKNSYEITITKKDNLKKIVQGNIIGVVDDILETGGTLDGFHDECMKLGAKKIVALITHGVLKKGIKRIRKKYSKLYLTNTIKQAKTNMDVVDIVAKYIK